MLEMLLAGDGALAHRDDDNERGASAGEEGEEVELDGAGHS